ncbi:hypothetical protein K0M31_012359 [Melipona bicolor]|uniref:Uncharacterized protein n=1 Tax=Melipona bicolor TaxID=60889 RepID=A0AA40FK83_9HYME|nr:hypothetical protein K0M31_012359 [Melipona bicolor]
MAMKRRRDCATPFSRQSTPWYNLLGVGPMTDNWHEAFNEFNAIRQFLQSCTCDRV